MDALASLTAQLTALDDDFMVFTATESLPSAAQLDAAERAVGCPLAPEHRALIERFGALAVVAKEEVWPRPVAFEIRPQWQFGFSVEVFGVVPTPALDLVAQAKQRAASGGGRFVPLLRVAGSPACVGYDARGQLHEWRHGEVPVALERADLLGLVSELVATLAVDKERIKGDPPKAGGPAAAASHDVDALMSELHDPHQDVRIAAAEALQASASPRAVEPLLAALARAKQLPRWYFGVEVGALSAAVGKLAPGDDRVIDALLSGLVVEESQHAGLPAFTALGEMGPAAGRAIPALRALTRDADAWRRANAHAALMRVEGNQDEHARALVGFLGNQEDGGAPSAVAEIALGRLGDRGLRYLEEAAAHADPAVRARASELLGG